MTMVVTCMSCGSLFRLDEALLGNAKGARIRCRKCGEYFFVRNRNAPPIPPAPAVEPEVASERQEGPRESTLPPPARRKTVGADLSDRVRPVPSPSPSAAVAGSNPFGDATLRDIVKPGTAWKTSSRRRQHARPLHIVAGLSVILFAGGALYFGTMQPGQSLPGKGFPKGGSANPVGAMETPAFEIQDVKWFLNKQNTGESLYVIKGTVVNVGKGNSNGIRIEATLMGADNQAILKNGAFAGNLIDETLLPHMTRVRIEGFLGMRYGEGNANRNIPAGKSLPFMVVFFDPPGQIASFTVKALEAEEQERVQSPVGKDSEPRAFDQRALQQN